MFDDYYNCPRTIARLRASPLAKELEAFTDLLHSREYTRITVRGYMRDVQSFARWLAAKKLLLDGVDKRVVRSFIRFESRHRYERPTTEQAYHGRVGIRHFLDMLRSMGVIPPIAEPQPGTIGSCMAEYDRHLSETCGFAFDTRLNRIRFAREFLRATFGNKRICWDRLKPKHFRSFVASFGRSGRIASAVLAVSALRGFLRWLVFQDRCSPHLISSIPSLHRCKYTSLPKVMTGEQLRAFLAAFDRSTPIGRRDYAMALCQLHLGLRVGEVAALTIDDIDWRNATISINGAKTRRGRVLPLLPSVGRAIASYLRRGRPNTDCRHLFIRTTFPAGRQVSRALIIDVFGRIFAKVPGCEGWRCSHVLRHTAAMRMYGRGVSLKAIADLLGHRSIDTTALYARVDHATLAAVALPWPRRRSHD